MVSRESEGMSRGTGEGEVGIGCGLKWMHFHGYEVGPGSLRSSVLASPGSLARSPGLNPPRDCESPWRGRGGILVSSKGVGVQLDPGKLRRVAGWRQLVRRSSDRAVTP